MIDQPMRTFQRSLPMQLLRAREAVMKEFLPHLRDADLTAQQWRVIRALSEEEALDMSAIADRCFLLMPSLSRIVQRLSERKLLARRGSADDQRRSMVRLTAAGRRLFERLAPISEQRYEALTRRFGYGKLELLYELIDDLLVSLNDPPD